MHSEPISLDALVKASAANGSAMDRTAKLFTGRRRRKEWSETRARVSEINFANKIYCMFRMNARTNDDEVTEPSKRHPLHHFYDCRCVTRWLGTAEE